MIYSLPFHYACVTNDKSALSCLQYFAPLNVIFICAVTNSPSWEYNFNFHCWKHGGMTCWRGLPTVPRTVSIGSLEECCRGVEVTVITWRGGISYISDPKFESGPSGNTISIELLTSSWLTAVAECPKSIGYVRNATEVIDVIVTRSVLTWIGQFINRHLHQILQSNDKYSNLNPAVLIRINHKRRSGQNWRS